MSKPTSSLVTQGQCWTSPAVDFFPSSFKSKIGLKLAFLFSFAACLCAGNASSIWDQLGFNLQEKFDDCMKLDWELCCQTHGQTLFFSPEMSIWRCSLRRLSRHVCPFHTCVLHVRSLLQSRESYNCSSPCRLSLWTMSRCSVMRRTRDWCLVCAPLPRPSKGYQAFCQSMLACHL